MSIFTESLQQEHYMSEIKEFKRDYPLRILKIYKKYHAFSKFSFSFALMTFQSVMAVLGDTQGKNLAKEIQQNDLKKDLAKYSFFYSPHDNQNDYWNCFNNLRNASSHILENYTPKNNEHKFVKISYTTNKMGRNEHKEITSKDLKDFLLILLNLLDKKDPSIKCFGKYFYPNLLKKLKNIILFFKTQFFRSNFK